MADNKIAELAEWDFDLLDSELEAIEDAQGDPLDMADFGFEPLNTDGIMDELDDVDFDKDNKSQFHLTLTFSPEENEYVESFLKHQSKVELKNFLVDALKQRTF